MEKVKSVFGLKESKIEINKYNIKNIV